MDLHRTEEPVSYCRVFVNRREKVTSVGGSGGGERKRQIV